MTFLLFILTLDDRYCDFYGAGSWDDGIFCGQLLSLPAVEQVRFPDSLQAWVPSSLSRLPVFLLLLPVFLLLLPASVPWVSGFCGGGT